MKDKAPRVDTSIETDWFTARREGNIVVFSFKGNFLLNATISRAKDAVLETFDRLAACREPNVVLLLALPRKARREEYLTFFDMLSSSRLSKSDVLRLYRAVDQIVLSIIDSDLFFVHADCGKILPMFAGMAMACDYRIIGDNAEYQNPAMELGLVPKGGISWFISRKLGPGKAYDLLLDSGHITAKKAFELGFVNRCVPAKELESEALNVARTFAALPATSLRLAKRLNNYSLKGLAEYLEFENSELIKVLHQKYPCA